MNNNPEYVMKFLKQDNRLDSSILSQIEKDKSWDYKTNQSKRLMYSLTVFPFAAQ
jgi:hypothetical protein